MKNRIVLLISLSLLVSANCWADDLPNAKLENKMSEVYKNYNEAPTDEESWKMIQGQSGLKTYKTQKKDTLWDISEMLFGDPNYWPKVWSLNREILNPHEVAPGTVLSFTAGTLSEVPLFGVLPGKIQPQATPEVLALTLNAEIPPPRKETEIPAADLPQSIPPWSFRKDQGKTYVFDLNRPIRNPAATTQFLDYFVSEVSNAGEGEVLGSEMGMDSAAEFQYVFVRLDGAASNKQMTVVKEIGELPDPSSSRKAILSQVQGIIEILEPVNKSKNTYRAMVKKSFSAIEKGARLINMPVQKVTLSSSVNSATSVSAKIFGGQFGVSRRLFGTYATVFLNQGSSSGLSEGQFLPIYKVQSSRSEQVQVLDNQKAIGQLKIVKTTDHFSTAVIMKAIEEVRVGDLTTPVAEEVKE